MFNHAINGEVLESLQKIALKNVLQEDVEFYIEKCYRYYSRTYSTPLHVVKRELTAEEVVLIYMEDEFLEAPTDKLIELATEFVNDDYVLPVENAAPRQLSDEEWIALENKKLQDAESKSAKQSEILKKTQEALAEFGKTIDSFAEEGTSDFNIKE